MTAHDLVEGYRTFADAEELAASPTGEYLPTTTIFTISYPTTATPTITN
jgi:hypothetical protein